MKYKLKTNGVVVLIDSEDFKRVNQYSWYLVGSDGKPRYAYCGKLNISMHGFILGIKEGFDIDHINHSGLDNRKINLRHCTRSENIRNSKKYIRSKAKKTSIYTGVSWDKEKKRWRAQITINNKVTSLGRFSDEVEAAKSYDNALKGLNLSFTKLNFIY